MISPLIKQPYLMFIRSMSSSAVADQAVGFVGLGNMGLHMATRLVTSGLKVLVYDRNPDVTKVLAEKGAVVASCPREIATTPGVQAVVTMLPSTEHVKDVYLGDTGLLKGPPGEFYPRLLIDSSTISPIFSEELAHAACEMRLHPSVAPLLPPTGGEPPHPSFVDAPVSGGVPGAQDGTLTFMAGGRAEAVQAAEEYLLRMGRKVVHCGPAGAGQAAKVCNNLVLGISMAAVAEGLALGRELGLHPAVLTAVFNTSSARCWSSEIYNPCPGVMGKVPSSRNYKRGFGASLMVKDLRLALESATARNLPTPLASTAIDLYRKVVETSGPATDFSAVYRDVYGVPEELPSGHDAP